MGKFDMQSLGVPIGPVVAKPDQKSYLVYGEPGSGKTRLAASASEVPELSPVLMVDLEAGSDSIENVYNDPDSISVIRPGDWHESKAVIEALLNEDHGFKTVIIDTVGQLMKFMEKELDKSRSNNGFEKWAKLADTTLEYVEMLHRSGLNVIILAHTDAEKDERTGKVKTMPYFLGRKTGKEGPKIFSVIGYLYVDTDDDGDPIRVLQTEGYDGITAKDRTDTLPVALGKPTYAKMFKYLQEGKPGKGRDIEEAEAEAEPEEKAPKKRKPRPKPKPEEEVTTDAEEPEDVPGAEGEGPEAEDSTKPVRRATRRPRR